MQREGSSPSKSFDALSPTLSSNTERSPRKEGESPEKPLAVVDVDRPPEDVEITSVHGLGTHLSTDVKPHLAQSKSKYGTLADSFVRSSRPDEQGPRGLPAQIARREPYTAKEFNPRADAGETIELDKSPERSERTERTERTASASAASRQQQAKGFMWNREGAVGPCVLVEGDGITEALLRDAFGLIGEVVDLRLDRKNPKYLIYIHLPYSTKIVYFEMTNILFFD